MVWGTFIRQPGSESSPNRGLNSTDFRYPDICRYVFSYIALALFIIYGWTARGTAKDHSVWTRTIILKTIGSGVIGMGVGMTLVMFALTGGEAGIVSTLSSAAPVVMLPVLWVTSQERPALGAWIGALIVFFGTALILNLG